MTHVILASQSPRRKELLANMGVTFDTIVSEYEEVLDSHRDTTIVAKELALGKAMDVATKYRDAYVIGSDTIVTIDGRQLGKPADTAEAVQMLRDLSGRVNYVTTGLALVNIAKNVRLLDYDTTAVYFNELTDEAIEAYVATGDPMDKAGGYALQRLLGTMISHIEGDEDTVIGLPTRKLAGLFDECDIAHAKIDS